MKYVRTREWVYKTSKDYKRNDAIRIFVIDSNGDFGVEPTFWLNKNEIIAKSDTIEELCDGFFLDFISDLYQYKNIVSEEKIFNRYRFDNFKEQFNAYRELEGDVYNHCDGYGFIKTDKGLIYVAKLNENGELELI